MNWYIGPWLWATDRGGYWTPPVGFAGLDLRKHDEMSSSGGVPGVGLFAGTGSLGSDYKLLGSGAWDEVRPDAVGVSAIPVRSGYNLKGDNLCMLVHDLLTDGCDPDGLEASRPLMPGTHGNLELVCRGHVHKSRFEWGKGHTNKIKHALRKEFEQLHDDATKGKLKDVEHHRRVLDFWCDKYKVSDWKEFVPTKLQPHIEGRLKHETTITENFTRADSSSAIGNLLTWTQVSGTWGTYLNQGYLVSSAGQSGLRAESDLSSADHYAQILLAPDGLGVADDFMGGAVRFNPSAETFYFAAGFSNALYLTKRVTGTNTNLTNTALTYATNKTYKTEINGSTLKGFHEGAEILSTTDTSITGYVRTGVTSLGINHTFDSFEAADLGGGGTAVPVFLNHLMNQG